MFQRRQRRMCEKGGHALAEGSSVSCKVNFLAVAFGPERVKGTRVIIEVVNPTLGPSVLPGKDRRGELLETLWQRLLPSSLTAAASILPSSCTGCVTTAGTSRPTPPTSASPTPTSKPPPPRRRSLGVVDAYVEDLRAELVDEFFLPVLQMHARYEGRYLLGTSIARIPTARGQMRYAKRIGGNVLVHGSTGKGNDQVRFESIYRVLQEDPEYTLDDFGIYAPWKEADFLARSATAAAG